MKRERNHEKHIAGRSMVSSARCAASFGMPSCTRSSSTSGHAREGSSVGEKKPSGRIRSTSAASTQNAASSSACTNSSVDATRFIPWQYPTAGLRL